MIFESCAVIAVILVMAIMIFRSVKNSGYSVGVLPLTLVPAVHIVGILSAPTLSRLLHVEPIAAVVALDIFALLATGLLLGAISHAIKSRRLRWGYLVTCSLFTAILTCVLVMHTI
jgi:hypothetical protein